MGKILVTLDDSMIAPRFDLTTEVCIVTRRGKGQLGSTRSILLPGPSADDLCGLILRETITVLICGGIEEEHYEFLTWKKVRVIDRVIGRADDALKKFKAGELESGAIVGISS